jgi:DNA-binding MarR family transcriptional regulator
VTARKRAAARPAPGAPPPRVPLDGSLFFKLVRVVNLTARPFVETLSRTHDLSLNEWRVMVVLAGHPGVAATGIADHTGLDKMSVSRAIAALDGHGRLVKRADPADARRTLLALNAAGRRLFETIGALAAEREAQLFGGVAAAELDYLGDIMDRLVATLQAAPPIPSEPE